jgi:multicomponent Na+:H+ antiporter subunit C
VISTPHLVLVVVIGVLFAGGVYLMLERSLSRVLVGIILISNGANLLMLVVGGAPGGAPIVGITPEPEMSDPLPQAMVLTAIVITLGMSAFLLAMAYRSWQLNEHDEVQDDLEDRSLARLAATDEGLRSELGFDGTVPATVDEEAAEARDEMALFGEERGEVDWE